MYRCCPLATFAVTVLSAIKTTSMINTCGNIVHLHRGMRQVTTPPRSNVGSRYLRQFLQRPKRVSECPSMTLRAGKMMVVLTPTANTVVMRPIRKLYPSKQSHIYQLFDRTIDRGSAYAWLSLS